MSTTKCGEEQRNLEWHCPRMPPWLRAWECQSHIIDAAAMFVLFYMFRLRLTSLIAASNDKNNM